MLKIHKKLLVACFTILCTVLIGAAAGTAQPAPGDTVAVASPMAGLLPDNLAGLKSTDTIKTYAADTLEGLVGAGAPVYREYKVVSAESRLYGGLKVEIFQSETRSGAFGLFSYKSDVPVSTIPPEGQVSGSSTFVSNGINFWRGSIFVRIEPSSPHATASRAALTRLANAISAEMGSAAGPQKPPSLVESLPAEAGTQPKARLFLGPLSLSDFLPHASDMFSFGGDAEAVLSSYTQQGKPALPLKLLIVEYNTPQFAHDALDRANGVLSQLTPDEQNQIVLKRIGNYLVEASDVTERPAAERLVDSVKYPYTVKWFQVPFHRKEDPHAGQKAAQILLSSFSIIGLLLSSALMGGGIFGAIIFMKRRNRQRGVFSDAGGMLRLDIEELCVGISGRALPPAGQSAPEDESR
ncbi:MAG TPA: DUF6599 family protein [Blastocatellia bacterium]